MTPDEAVAQLADGLTIYGSASVKAIVDAVVATAKAEGKADETRRCAKVAREITQGETGMHYGHHTANKILTTGGLEAGVTDGKMKV